MAQIKANTIFTVSQVTYRVKRALEDDAVLRYIKVRGEVINFKRSRAASGWDYLYFSLKDAKTLLPVVMQLDPDEPTPCDLKNGDVAICEGEVAVYPPQGKYELMCDSISEDGEGAAADRLKKLTEKLQKEGLFDQERPLPRYPKKIAVVTSPTGAAIEDIKNVISRRYPICELCVIPAIVQGENAVPTIIRGIKQAQTVGADLIIFGRGGGSSEDLDCFNSEALAREIFNSKIPTISAVGHQIDWTIADRTADLRVETPTAAAELATPDKKHLLEMIAGFRQTASHLMSNKLHDTQRELSLLEKDVRIYSPLGRISAWEHKLSQNLSRISDSMHRRLEQNERKASDIMPKLSVAMHRRLEQSERKALDIMPKLSVAMHRRLEQSERKASDIMPKLSNAMHRRLEQSERRASDTMPRISVAIHRKIERSELALQKAAQSVSDLNPMGVLARGYSMTEKNGHVITDAKELSQGDKVSVKLEKGGFTAQVIDVKE